MSRIPGNLLCVLSENEANLSVCGRRALCGQRQAGSNFVSPDTRTHRKSSSGHVPSEVDENHRFGNSQTRRAQEVGQRSNRVKGIDNEPAVQVGKRSYRSAERFASPDRQRLQVEIVRYGSHAPSSSSPLHQRDVNTARLFAALFGMEVWTPPARAAGKRGGSDGSARER